MNQERRKTDRMALWIFTVTLFAALAGSPAQAAEPQIEPPLSTPAPPAEWDPDIFGQPMPMAKCSFCDTTPFNPTPTVLCTFAGTCQPGTNCCDYTCQCGEDTGNTSIPATACSLDVTRGCSTAPFNPRWGVVCTFDCFEDGQSCCEYSCRCGKDTGNTTIPADACTLDIPSYCCPGGHALCQVSYCDGEGVRCVNDGCGVGCCTYSCVPDPTCTGVDPLPPDAC